MELLLLAAAAAVLMLRRRRTTLPPTEEQRAVAQALTVEIEGGAVGTAQTAGGAASVEVTPDALTGIGVAAAGSLLAPQTWVNPAIAAVAIVTAIVVGIREAQRLQDATFRRLFPLLDGPGRRIWIANKARGLSQNLLTSPWYFAGRANFQEAELVRLWGTAPYEAVLERVEANALDPTWIPAKPSDKQVIALFQGRAHVEGGVVVAGPGAY